MLCISIDPKRLKEGLSFKPRLNYMLELRLDLLAKSDPLPSISELETPTIFTYRTISQGGRGGDLQWALEFQKSFVSIGRYFFDVEFAWPRAVKEVFFNIWQERVILSMHILNHTPPLDELKFLFIRMAEGHPRFIKIVTYATSAEDNLTIKRLLRWALDKETRLISFAMGPLGLISRVMCVKWGSFMTYASLPGEPLADGQISVHTLLEFWKEEND